MVLALPELAILAAFLLAFVVVYNLRKFTEGIIGMVHAIVGGIPFIGSIIESGINTVMQPMAHALGDAEKWIDNAIGTSLHLTAQLIRQTYDFLERSSSAYATLARFLLLMPRLSDIAAVYRALRSLIRTGVHGVSSVISHTTVIARTVTKTVGTNVLPRLRTAEHEIAGVIEHDIPSLRGATRTLEDEYAKLGKLIRSHPWTAVTGAFVAAVAVALSKLGLEWIKCDAAKGVFRKRGCNMWNDLDGLLTAALAVATAMSLVELAKAEQEVVGDLSAVVRRFWQV